MGLLVHVSIQSDKTASRTRNSDILRGFICKLRRNFISDHQLDRIERMEDEWKYQVKRPYHLGHCSRKSI